MIAFRIVRIFQFQSTPSGGKATGYDKHSIAQHKVSIHAFRGEGDQIEVVPLRIRECFNPHLPGGRRRLVAECCVIRHTVSIHAFRGEGDTPLGRPISPVRVFQSTPSGGKATPPIVLRSVYIQAFQSTPSGGKATVHAVPRIQTQRVSIHAFRGEGDQEREWARGRERVSIHAFRGEGDASIIRFITIK